MVESLKDLSNVSWNFHDLMLYRVHEILIVSSPYDAFILEEDGRLAEQILHEYLGMDLRYAPRVWRASTAADAQSRLDQRNIDLLITMLRVSDMDPISFGRQVKEEYPEIPVILLAYDTAQMQYLPDPFPEHTIDQLFIWTGNSNVLTAIIKSIEDRRNVDRDIRKADVRAVLVIEDDPYYYSVILPLIYSEVYYHTRNLLDKSLNDTHRLLRMRGRPKVLLATDYEEAEEYLKLYRENILGVISDTRFPINGEVEEEAGFKFARWVYSIEPQMPIMLQSTNEENLRKAEAIGAHFLYKKSRTLLSDIREFMLENFGFGDFVFRTPEGRELARATDLLEFQKQLYTVPEESLLYHASSNHISNWCAARGEFQLASILRPLKISDFDTTREMRKYIIEAIDTTRYVQQKGRIVEFSRHSYDPSANIASMRTGSLGGKARGLAFINTVLDRADLERKFPNTNVRIPKITVIGTDEFDEFMNKNHLWEPALNAGDDAGLKQHFLRATLSKNLMQSLRFYLEKHRFPLFVRSSSLLEDSHYLSPAGMYSTYVLPNWTGGMTDRLKKLCEAIKLVYASVFFQAPKSFLDSSIHHQEEEKMAVIIQELAGQRYGENRFYPTFSGVAQSINYYPFGQMEREDGIAYVALGLGKTVVEMEKSLRFCPKYPQKLPQFSSPQSILDNSQRHFYALNLTGDDDFLTAGESAHLGRYDLSVAEEDGSLKWVGSVLNPEDNILRDSLTSQGTRVVTFADILKWNAFPLSAILEELLEIGEASLGCPMEIEFAGNLYNDARKTPEFYFLQIRPMAIMNRSTYQDDFKDVGEEEIFCRSDKTLGDGLFNNIRDIIYVKPAESALAHSREIADEIGRFNGRAGPDRPYLLIGPGRWGSADPWLGIPVAWNQISHARVMVEYNPEGSHIEPSFGGHFFQNITRLHIGYLTINRRNPRHILDWDWLHSQRVEDETDYIKWITVDSPITIHIDSSDGNGICRKPDMPESEVMDESGTSGM